MNKYIKHFLYYIAVPIIFYLFLWLINLVFVSDDLGVLIVLSYAVVFVFVPALTFILMRFSMLPWVLDPFAALELPLMCFALMLWQNCKRYGSFDKAVDRLDDVWLYFVVWFVFALVCTISFRRKNGDFFIRRIKSYF